MPPITSTIRYATLPSFLGEILVAATRTGVTRVAFQEGTTPCEPGDTWVHDPSALAPTLDAFRAWFDGDTTRLDLPRHTHGTAFQEQIWDRVSTIPYGEHASYGALARELGKPNAARAVGQANGANPVPILVPCHRVIASAGQLTGFSAGLEIKEQLIEHELRVQPPVREQLGLFA